jgi:hypothetical protein
MGAVEDALRHGWLTLIAESMGHALRPVEIPTVHASGPLPYRVLLVGGGVAVGLGVTRRDRALPGHIARHLASITGRGVDLDVTAWVGMTLGDARAELDGRDPTRYDAIMLTLGSADALARLPVEDWRARLEPLLLALTNRTPPETRIVVVGADASVWSPYLNPLITRSPARRLDDFNEVSRELCWALPRTSYLAPVGKPSSDTTQYSVLDYDHVGRVVAAHLARRLARRPPPPAALGPSLTPDAAGLTDLSHDAVVDHVVGRARAAFGVEGATLTVLDRAEGAPEAGSLHAATAAEPGGLAVRNLSEDARFSTCPLARRHRMAFYAGHPVYAPSGECIAVLSIFDPRPRSFSLSEMAVLRDHALLIQEALARPVPARPRISGRRERPSRTDTAPARLPGVRSPRHV